MRIIVCENYEEVSKKAAQMILSQITLKPNSVLGLATGSTPVGMYKNLIQMNKEGHVDFSEVQTFNLDEYYKLPRTNDQSYYYFMHENLFNHINIDHKNVYIPNGMANDIESECERYDEAIKEVDNKLAFKRGEEANVTVDISYHTEAALEQIIEQIMEETDMTVACEGDLGGLVTMMLMRSISGTPALMAEWGEYDINHNS